MRPELSLSCTTLENAMNIDHESSLLLCFVGAQSAPSMGAAQAVPNFGGAGMTMGGTGALNGSRRRLQVRRNR